MNPTSSLFRRKLYDRLARWVVSAGGLAIIAAVLGILLFILIEVYPLLVSPTASSPATSSCGRDPIFIGCEEYDEIAFAVLPEGAVQFITLADGTVRSTAALLKAGGRKATTAYQQLGSTDLYVGLDDGRVLPVAIAFELAFREDPANRLRQIRSMTPSAGELDPITLDPEGRPVRSLVRRDGTKGARCFAAIVGEGQLVFLHQVEKKLLSGAIKRSEQRTYLAAEQPTCLSLERSLQHLYVGTADGRVLHFDIREPAAPIFVRAYEVSKGAVTALQTLNGDASFIVGDATGAVSVWMLVRDEGNEFGWTLTRIRDLEKHDAPVSSIWPSVRDKGFVTADRAGTVKLHHSTSDQTLFTLRGQASPIRNAYLTPRSTAVLALHEGGALDRWTIHNPHPETTLHTLFGKVWYEGYDKPEYVWQSTGGTDDFEPKFSLVPLLFGTFKGTIYALLIGVPIALLGALFTSQFLHVRVRNVVKPVIEIMAALPSVVLGFLAGLWLAPYMERIAPAIFSMAIVLPTMAMLGLGLWTLFPRSFKTRWREKLEIVFLLVMTALGIWLSLSLNGPLQHGLFKGDFGQWWFSTTGLKYDQRNALVVGFAMGFAVIPIIFTISEDALANVPRHLSSGSLALGATRWQTAVRVVLPTASPGVFSAILVGFGRAVGETMIVLMATGNTPIMEWNLFNGFRTLSANIAVEIPEAPHGDTLYRTLFLAALLLFICTFIVNTLAESIRMTMRKRYAQL